MIRQIHLTVGAFALFAVAFGAMLVGSAGDSYAAPNLVVNGTFDTDTANWSPASANATLTWDGANDVNSNPASGSMNLAAVAAGFAEGVSDCFALTGDATYPYEAYVRKGAQWDAASRVDITFVRFASVDCTGGPPTTTSHGSTDLGVGTGWVLLNGSVVVAGPDNGSMLIALTVDSAAAGDSATWDEVKIADTELDTPTPTNTATATNTPVPTNTPAPTDTPVATNTPAATNTPLPTDTPVATNTAAPTGTAGPATNTPEPPTATPETLEVGAPPASAADTTGGTGAGGESPDGSAGAGGEEPEAGEVPESGTGPRSYSNERSHVADMIAVGSFALAIIMLGAGFALRKNYEEA